MNDGLRRPTWRQSLSVVALLAAAGCAGSASPTSPSLSGAGAPASSAVVQPAGQPQTGTAGTVFVEVQPGVFGFAAAVEDGVTGRNVQLTGDIVGINFEPGTCVAGVDMSLGFPTSCVVFGDGPGQFVRARPGGTAFTTCHCTVAGVGDPDDQVTLRISYPTATPPRYPFGFTKFAFQDGTGDLAPLRGQGTLDFASNPAVSFSYQFASRP